MKFCTVAGLSWSKSSTSTLLGPVAKPEIWKLTMVPWRTVRLAELVRLRSRRNRNDNHRIKAGLVGADVAEIEFVVGRPSDVGPFKYPLITGCAGGSYDEIGGRTGVDGEVLRAGGDDRLIGICGGDGKKENGCGNPCIHAAFNMAEGGGNSKRKMPVLPILYFALSSFRHE